MTDDRPDLAPQPPVAADSARRRILQGALVLAPTIMTLRSGALAATSCTGTIVIQGSSATPGNVNPNQMCVQAEVSGCPDGFVHSLSASQQPAEEQVEVCVAWENPDNSQNPGQCMATELQGTGKYYCPSNTPIIVSANAYTSLTRG